MMAFFLLLWLLNITSKEQKEGLLDYFTPTVTSTNSTSEAGDIYEGMSINTDGTSASAVSAAIPGNVVIKEQEVEVSEEESFEIAMANRKQEAFDDMATELSLSIQDSAEFSKLDDQVIIDVKENGMRIQLVDQDNRSMFRDYTAELYSYAERMIRHIAIKVDDLPNRIAISGHSGSLPFRAGASYSNWELSSDRAHIARRVMSSLGVSADRFA